MTTPRVEGQPLGRRRPEDFNFDNASLNPDLVEALRHGSIPDILREVQQFGVSRVDIERFLESQSRRLNREVYQVQPYASFGAMEAPRMEYFIPHNPEMKVEPGELKTVNDAFGKAMSLRAMKGVDEDAPEGGEEEPFDVYEAGDELTKLVDDTINQITENAMWNAMESELKKTNRELEDQLNRAIAIAKAGGGEEAIIVMLHKVTAAKNGVLLTHVGKRLWHWTDRNKKLGEAMDPSKPDFFKMRGAEQELQMNIKMDMMALDQITGKISASMSSASSMLGMLRNYRDQMLGHIGR